jgi:hypothetical protein
MKDIIYQEATTADPRIKVGILIYKGAGDPVVHLNNAVDQYVGNESYNEFIDANMDNPWVRVIIKGINEMTPVEFNPQVHKL